MYSLVKTPNLDFVLNNSKDSKVDMAIAELIKLREIQEHLVTHLRASKAQCEFTATGLRALIS